MSSIGVFECALITDKMGRESIPFFVALFVLFCFSIDYAVVMPSLWLLLRSFDPSINELWLGLCVGGFQLGNFLCQPLFGWWLDARPMKEVLVVQVRRKERRKKEKRREEEKEKKRGKALIKLH